MLDTKPAPRHSGRRLLVPLLAGTLLTGLVHAQGPTRLIGWNDLGMHCMDSDTSVFCILPPFNTFHAQLVVGGHVVNSGYTVTYEAVADPNGSINSTSAGKSDFWQHVGALFGANPPVNTGLAGFSMPGTANVPQNMPFHAGLSDFVAEGVPVTPYDDAGNMNPYPLMKLVARNAAGQVVASTTPVIPVSAEMACTNCHGSGANPDARPASGWVYGPAATDDRLNILKLHDDHHASDPVFIAAANAVGYLPAGLYPTAVGGQPILCAACHGSNALGTSGQPGVGKMTASMHTLHGSARLADGRRLDDIQDRSSCYTCHPGAATRCLRGAMGKAIGADGLEMMSCQDCHGSMSEVGDPARVGWLQEPNCQNCHTGDAVANAGAIRFDHAFSAPGVLRPTTNTRFATTPDSPQAGFSLYRFSVGHGGLECSACHGSPHAIWPSTENNDNLQSIAAQGHVGTIVECSSCHSGLQDTQWQGPHGMHPTGNSWVDHHGDAAEQVGVAACRTCHGTNYRGTVLSRSQGDRAISSQFGARTFWRGYEIGCYDCHNGPNSENAINNQPPAVTSFTVSTPTDTPVSMTLSATDPNTADVLTLRIVSQPRHGAVAFDGTTAVYHAWDGYTGADSFTYAASDTKRNSNLGTVTINVGAAACGSSQVFGYGCALPDGSVPSIHVDGCALGGQNLDFVVDQIPSSGFGILALGTGRAAIELDNGGCALRMATLLGTTNLLPVVNGTMNFQVQVPPGLGNWSFVMQGFCLTAAAQRGFVATPGLEVTLP